MIVTLSMTPVVSLDGIVRMPLNGVLGRGDQFVEHPWVIRSAVCRDLGI
jgi:hypothetical protein